ncbi:MAG TPA: response regulator, partial [Xanthobacteraceae bacterium]|nr:response regulator [Xanthobacteraceae bacterium]
MHKILIILIFLTSADPWHGLCSFQYGSDAKSGSRTMCAKSNVLIVDDDEVVRLSHLRSLKSVACDAEAAEGGEDALQMMERHPFDVVLLDLRMPGMDGMSVL